MNLFRPQQVGIELVRGCNFDCPMCPVTSNAPLETQRFQFMSPELLEGLAAEIDKWPSIGTIWFFNFGEPMAHPRFRECLGILARSDVARRAHVVQHTNASLLRGDKAEALLEVPIVKKLVFSFDGFGDRGSFERLRGPHYEGVLDNIRRFVPIARERRPDLQLATCTILPREGEVPGLVVPPREEALRQLDALFGPLGVAVETREMHDYSGNDKLEIAGRGREAVFAGCAFVENDSLYFTVDGWAQPCCAVYDKAFNVGRFPEQGFGQLLNNEAMRDVRRDLRLDRRERIPSCRNCSLSLGGWLSPEALAQFWKAREQMGHLDDPAERQHVRSLLPPEEVEATGDPAAS